LLWRRILEDLWQEDQGGQFSWVPRALIWVLIRWYEGRAFNDGGGDWGGDLCCIAERKGGTGLL